MESLGGLLFPLLILLLFIPIFLSGRKQRRQAQEQQQLMAKIDEAARIAAGIPGARFGSVEVRGIMTFGE